MKFFFFAPLFAAAYVSAHGFVSEISVDGKVYKGNSPGASPKPSIIRQIDDPSPVKGSANPSVNCGKHAPPASLVAQANPGSLLAFTWKAGENENWPHNTGPMLTYMASCGSTTCDKFDPTGAKWFKIEQVGRQPDGNWVQANLMNGAPAKVVIPKTIAPGNYMIRHEIIALHLATSFGGAEFYPSCAQFNITGTQTGTPTEAELVSLPGAYKDSDPGIFDPSVFDTNAKYTFPGPPVAAFVSAESGNNGVVTSGSASPTAASAPLPSTTKKGSSGTCKTKKKKVVSSSVGVSTVSTSSPVVAPAVTTGPYYPRHYSRVMRRW